MPSVHLSALQWTYVTRASGIVATVLIVAALAGGLLFSARSTGWRRRPNWWLDLHNYLGGLAFAFSALHVVASYRDKLNGLGLLQLFVPLTATGWAWGITWGVLAMYLFAAVVFTSWPRKRLSRRTWLLVHLSSLPATLMVATHAWMIGSDGRAPWMAALLALLSGLTVYPAVLRLASTMTGRRAKAARAANAATRSSAAAVRIAAPETPVAAMTDPEAGPVAAPRPWEPVSV